MKSGKVKVKPLFVSEGSNYIIMILHYLFQFDFLPEHSLMNLFHLLRRGGGEKGEFDFS